MPAYATKHDRLRRKQRQPVAKENPTLRNLRDESRACNTLYSSHRNKHKHPSTLISGSVRGPRGSSRPERRLTLLSFFDDQISLV